MDARDERIAELEKEVAALRAQVAVLLARLEAAERAGKRQASPFSKGPRVGPHKKPGRKPGEGPFERRGAPSPDSVTDTEQAPLEEAQCACGGEWERSVEESSITDLPAQPKPKVTVFLVAVGCCKRCGKKARGRHPKLPEDQHGATAHRVGERAKAAAHALHYGLGIPVRKVPLVLAELCGLAITQSAITQDGLKRAEGPLAAVEAQLRADIPASPTANTDDTGWRVGGNSAQLMNFNNPDTSVFQIRRQHRNEEVREVIPATYPGVLGTDRGAAYDAVELENVRQQKCNFHILRNLAKAMEHQDARNQWFCRQVKDVIHLAMDLHRSHLAGEVSTPLFAQFGALFNDAMSTVLRPRVLRHPDNQRLLNELGRQHDRGNILRYLEDPRIEPTNNSSERELRGGVCARKVSGCSKNWRGALAHGVYTSIIRTNLRRLRDTPMIDALLRVFRTGLAPPRIITF